METGALVTDQGDSVGAACADYDNDGDLDLFVADAGDGANFLYENNSESNGNNWIKIKLTGTTSNRYAVGARIEVRAEIGGKTVRQVREISTQTAHVGQNSMIAHFGLGDAPAIEEIRVVWPSGDFALYDNVAMNQLFTLTEDGVVGTGEIAVSQAGVEIPDGGTYDLGEVTPNYPHYVDFTIDSLGPDPLVLTGTPVVSISGADADDFSVYTEPTSQVGVGESTTFTIRLAGLPLQDRTAYLTIYTNDPDESTYNITLTTSGSAVVYGFFPVSTGSVVTDNNNSFGCAWADYDGDGDEDLFVANDNEPNILYSNDGDGTFTKVSAGVVVTDVEKSYGVSWGDYNNDGFPDLFVVNYDNETNSLYRNNSGGTFTKVTTGTHVTDVGNSYSCSWVDYDCDGYLDIFVANKSQPNCLYRNNGDGSFIKVNTGEIVTDTEDSMGCAWGDYDNNGYPDLFVANEAGTNSLYANNGDGTFTKVITGPVVTDTADSVGGSWGDYDNDGDLDLFVSNWGNDVNFLYTNDGDGTFTKVTSSPVVMENGDSSGSLWVDYDHDGDLDLLVGNKNITLQNDLYRNDGDGTFTKITEGNIVLDEEQSQGVSCVDYDNDGDTDLFITNLNGYNALYKNLGNGNNSIRIKCTGENSNGSAIGTRVKVKAVIAGSVVWQMREITGQTGLGSQSSMVLFFGLGDALTVDEIQIQWPTGVTETLTDIAANQLLEITENFTAQSAAAEGRDNSYQMNETGFSTVHELYDIYDTGENLHGPNMETYAGNMSTPTGSNMSGVKTSTLVDTYYIYSFDGKLMAEYDHDGNCVKEYIYMGNQLMAEYQPQTAKYYYYVSDQINSTRKVLDDNGDTVHSTSYGPYGQILDTYSNGYEPKLKFSGKEREGYSDLDYFGARYYDNQSFRFNSIDPIINRDEALFNPQLWNLYAYCRNNPITYLDPDGRESFFSFVWRNKWSILEMGAGAALHFVGGGSDVGTGVLVLSGGGAELAPATVAASAAAKTLGTMLIVDAVVRMANSRPDGSGNDNTNVKGGGKTGRKINTKRAQSLNDQIAEAKEALKNARTKYMKALIRKKIKHLNTKLQKSGVHTRTGQGYRK